MAGNICRSDRSRNPIFLIKHNIFNGLSSGIEFASLERETTPP